MLEDRFIREVEYPNWLANVMIVPKKDRKWRVCVDYTDEDNFLLLQIDQIVTRQPDMECSCFSMPFSDTIKHLCIHQILRKLPSLPHRSFIATM